MICDPVFDYSSLRTHHAVVVFRLLDDEINDLISLVSRIFIFAEQSLDFFFSC